MAFARQLIVLEYQRPSTLWATHVPTCQGLLQPLSARESVHGAHLLAEATGLSDMGDMLFASGGLIEPIVMHVSLVARQHVLHQPKQKLACGQRQRLVEPIAVILVSERDLLSLIADDPPLREGRPTGVTATVGSGLLAVAIAAHDVDDEPARILAIEPTDRARKRTVVLKFAAQSAQQVMLPEPA